MPLWHSELETRLAGGVGQALDPAMILVASTVEANLVNTGLLGPLGDHPADDGGGGLVAAVGGGAADLGVERAGRGQGPAVVVVDDLHVDVLGTPEDGQAGPLGGPVEPLAHMALAAEPSCVDEFSLFHRTVLIDTRGVPGRPIPTGRPAPTLENEFTRRVASPGLLGTDGLAG